MPVTNTDSVLWYNVGEFGKIGYGVPNWSNDVGSLNPQILDWTYLVGRNLFHIMHHENADLRIPPSINTAKRIHKPRVCTKARRSTSIIRRATRFRLAIIRTGSA